MTIMVPGARWVDEARGETAQLEGRGVAGESMMEMSERKRGGVLIFDCRRM